eukprot:752138-Hanusia_phi.AAC.4
MEEVGHESTFQDLENDISSLRLDLLQSLMSGGEQGNEKQEKKKTKTRKRRAPALDESVDQNVLNFVLVLSIENFSQEDEDEEDMMEDEVCEELSVNKESCWDEAFKQARMLVQHVSLQTMMETHELIAESHAMDVGIQKLLPALQTSLAPNTDTQTRRARLAMRLLILGEARETRMEMRNVYGVLMRTVGGHGHVGGRRSTRGEFLARLSC